MTLSLAITDSADGTGGTATFSGSIGGSTNTLYIATFTGAMGTPTWTTVSSRIGDGTIAVAPGNGYYLFYGDSLSGGSHFLTNSVYQNLTDATQSVHYRCLLGTQTVLRTLAFVPPAQVYVGWVPRNLDAVDAMPGIAVNPFGREGQPGTLTGRDDINYPVTVTFFDTQAQGNAENLARDLLWRQRAFRAFRHQRLAGVPEIFTADVVPDPVADAGAYKTNLWVSSFLINFRSREVRGLS